MTAVEHASARPPALGITGAKERRRGQPEGEPITEALRRVDAATADINGGATPMEQETQQAEPEQRPDPAPSAPAIAEERARQLVTNISSSVLGEMRGLRDQIDDLMRDVNERRDMIVEAIRAHGEYAETAIQAKVIIGESVARLRAEFDKSRSPLPPARTA